MRALVWLAIVFAVVLGHVLGDERISAAVAPLVILALWFGAPRILRSAVLLVAAAVAFAWILDGASAIVDILPCLIAGLIGWLFARSLLRGRQPLIARAISAMDGIEPLHDPAVARYAKRLTCLWATFQFVLALFGLLCVIGVHGIAMSFLPSPHAFGMLILPLDRQSPCF